MRKTGLMLAAAAALSIASPANAVIVNYNFSGAGSGTMALDLTGGVYSLNALSLTLGTATFTQADSALAPFGPPTYLLGTTAFGGPGVAVSNQNTFYFVLNPSLSSQTAGILQYGNVGAPNQLFSGTLNINQFTPTAGVPEPPAWAMMLLGFAGIGLALRRKKVPALA
jgi:hypothetical protein